MATFVAIRDPFAVGRMDAPQTGREECNNASRLHGEPALSDHWVGLSEAITALHTQIQAARHGAIGQEIAFDVEEIHVEFLLEIVKEATGNSGISFGVVSFGMRGAATTGSTHKLTLTLKPRDSFRGGSVAISGEEDSAEH
jgi:hypothetical protein